MHGAVSTEAALALRRVDPGRFDVKWTMSTDSLRKNEPRDLRVLHLSVDGSIPVTKIHTEPQPRPAVIVLHGLGASTEVQRPELVQLAQSEFTAVGIDAPHHGARVDGWLERMAAARLPESHVMMLKILREAVPEVQRVIDCLVAQGHSPIGLTGISMGAYVALAVATEDDRVQATVSILGSPDWSPRSGPIPDEMRALMQFAPIERPAACARRPLLLCNAGRDVWVPAQFSRGFARVVAEQYPDLSPNVRTIEYPESEHIMRPQDWKDLWVCALAFLAEHLRLG